MRLRYLRRTCSCFQMKKRKSFGSWGRLLSKEKDVEKLLPLLMNTKYFKDMKITQEDLSYVRK